MPDKSYKKILFLLLSFGLFFSCADNEKNTPAPQSPNDRVDPPVMPGLDKSTLDMSYYPVDYPKLKMSGDITEPIVARIIYSRPKKDGRVIFGNVVKFGSNWRLGANEATEIEFFRNVTIQNQSISKGRYIIYCIPYQDKWIIKLNTDLFTWGLKIDSSKDAFKFEAPAEKISAPVEVFTMEFQKIAEGIQLNMTWDTMKAILPINY